MEYVPALTHRTVETIGKRALELLHPRRQIRFRRLQSQVVMVAHERVGMQLPAVPLARLERGRLEPRPGGTDREQILAIVAAVENVVTGVG